MSGIYHNPVMFVVEFQGAYWSHRAALDAHHENAIMMPRPEAEVIAASQAGARIQPVPHSRDWMPSAELRHTGAMRRLLWNEESITRVLHDPEEKAQPLQ